MSGAPVTVVIPVGPEKHHSRYLEECLQSVRKQTLAPREVLIVDDMHGVGRLSRATWPRNMHFRTLRLPWRAGVAGAFNAGVAQAQHDLAIMLGADDVLAPTCVERCMEAYEAADRAEGYYWLGVEYSDGRTQFLPAGAAMVTRGMFERMGGFPPETASGAPDAALISIMLVHAPEMIRSVDEEEPLYGYRVHDECDTVTRGPWQGTILNTRDLLTEHWKAPAWGRYR